MSDALPLVFDGHNDVLTRLWEGGGVANAGAFVDGSGGHLDLRKSRRGGFGGGFFAVWVPSPSDDDDYQAAMCRDTYDLPLPVALERDTALEVVSAQIATLRALEQRGALEVCTTVAGIRDCLERGVLAAILHLEGAEAIDPELHTLDALYAEGLRSLGPVWSRPTAFGHGVPFRYPSGPDIGEGLTAHGLRLIERCNELGVLIDLSHLNAAGVEDVAAHSVHPLVATHSNAHAICPHARNLTDDQLRTIAATDGMVGLNFATAFLREDGKMLPDVALGTLLRHLDHLIGLLGEDGVGLGSDFDGALVPEAIGDASGLATLREAMRVHGYDDALMAKLCHGNWLRVLERTWHGPTVKRPGNTPPHDDVAAAGTVAKA